MKSNETNKKLNRTEVKIKEKKKEVESLEPIVKYELLISHLKKSLLENSFFYFFLSGIFSKHNFCLKNQENFFLRN